MADFTKFGGTTPRVVIYKSESQKLHQAFPVKASVKIYAGNPVAITTDGTIELLTRITKLTTWESQLPITLTQLTKNQQMQVPWK